MSDTGKLYWDASMLAMRKKQVNRLQQENERIRDQTIEECARAAMSRRDGLKTTWDRAINEAVRTIRALKDKP